MGAQKFRKKPIEIEAIPVREALNYAANHWLKLPPWLRDAYDQGRVLFLNKEIRIKTLEGTMTASVDDMLIQGVQGELYPCKPDIFEATYEAVT